MTNFRPRKRWPAAVCCLALLALVPDRLHAQAQPVQDFLELANKWEQLVGISFHIEGRCSIYGKDVFFFTNCELPFRSEEPLPKLKGDGRQIAVSGKIAKRMGRLYFAVLRVEQLPEDLARVRQKRAAAPPRDARALYEIAEWALKRAEFYDDQDLLAAAHDTFVEGLRMEARAMPEPTAADLAALAEKAAAWELPLRIQLEYRHEALQLAWSELQSSAAVGEKRLDLLRELAERIQRELPGAGQPPTAADAEVSDAEANAPPRITRPQYADNPRAVYREADDAMRARMDRWFYREVVLRRIVEEAALRNWNGFKTADAITRALPDAAEVAREHRSRELHAQLERASSLNRNEVVSLAGYFRKDNQPEQARQALETWLQAQAERERREGPAGLMRLAREYEALLDDKQQAAKLLIEAYRELPEAEDVSRRLKALGYRLSGGEWLAGDDPRAGEVDPITLAMREGRVERGMTYEQVKSTLGVPNSIMRIASSGQVSEIWLYGAQGTRPLSVHFQRSTRRSDMAAEVVLVSQLPAGM